MKKTEHKACPKAAKVRQKAAKRRPKTQRDLAAVLGVSPALVNWHLKHSADAPGLDDPEEDWLAFLSANGREGSLPADLRAEIGTARKRLIEAQAARLERQNQISADELISKAEVQSAVQNALGAFWAGLERIFVQELPPTLATLDPKAIEGKCAAAVADLKETLRVALLRLGRVAEIDEGQIAIGRAAVEVLPSGLASSLSILDQQLFEEFRRQRLAEKGAQRLEWCGKRAEEGLPVYDASPEEMALVPGLKNRD